MNYFLAHTLKNKGRIRFKKLSIKYVDVDVALKSLKISQ